jgi:hypothetical protein
MVARTGKKATRKGDPFVGHVGRGGYSLVDVQILDVIYPVSALYVRATMPQRSSERC